VSLRTYSRWEAGDASPRGWMLVKIMELCPDEDSVSRFRSAAASLRSEASQNPADTPRLRNHAAADRLRVSLRNSCLAAIRIIYEAARLGSAAADEKLRAYADELNRSAAILAKDLGKEEERLTG
jgi:hypothetical protein